MAQIKKKDILRALDGDVKRAQSALKNLKSRLAALDLKYGKALVRNDLRSLKLAKELLKSRSK